MSNDNLIQQAASHIRDILHNSIHFNNETDSALVVFDTQDKLTDIITQAYRSALSNAEFIDFDTVAGEHIIERFKGMKANDLVVLIQTKSFRLNDYRIRINLFNQSLKVIEHLHLYRNPPATWESYVESLEYDQDWYQSKGKALQQSLAGATTFEIISHNSIGEKAKVEVMGGLEIPKLNIGDYTDMNTVGGTFPIGEVFTESKVLESLNGSFWVYGFANSSFDIIMPDPFRVDITDGIVTGWSNNAPNEFIEVIALIKAQERAIVREIGFGLNRGIKRENPLGDITAYERVIGVHLSLGEKHSVYKKQGISAHKARFHVDLFLDIDEVLVDSQAIFKNGEYLI